MKKIFLVLSTLIVTVTYTAEKTPKKKSTFYEYLVSIKHVDADLYKSQTKSTKPDSLIAAAQYIVNKELKIRKTNNREDCVSPFEQNQQSLNNILNQLDPKKYNLIAGLNTFTNLGPRPVTTPKKEKRRSRRSSSTTPSPCGQPRTFEFKSIQ